MNIIQINTVVVPQGGVQIYGLGDDNKLYIYMNPKNEPGSTSDWVDMNEAVKYIRQP